jgi:phage-related holin
MKLELKTLLYLIGTPMLAFFEPINTLLFPILWLIFIDILTGVYLVRIVKKEALTSRGFFKKLPQVCMFLVAVVASLHANPFFVQFGLPEFQAVKMVMSFYGLYELFSILENLGRSGLPVAKQISTMLAAKLPDEVKNNIPELKT